MTILDRRSAASRPPSRCVPEVAVPAWMARKRPGAMPVPSGPTIVATLRDGPLKGRSVDAEVVEGRPPKTIDVPVEGDDAGDGGCRYCLADWPQGGPSADYSFLYRV